MASKAKRDLAAMMALALPFFYSRRKAPEEKQPQDQVTKVARIKRAWVKREMRAGKLSIQAKTWKVNA